MSPARREEARLVARRAVEANACWADEWQRPPIFVRGPTGADSAGQQRSSISPSAGLTSRAWWTREDFPWATELESAYPAIKELPCSIL